MPVTDKLVELTHPALNAEFLEPITIGVRNIMINALDF